MLRRPEVLKEAFVPSDVDYRHDQLSQRANALDPLPEDGMPANDAAVLSISFPQFNVENEKN